MDRRLLLGLAVAAAAGASSQRAEAAPEHGGGGGAAAGYFNLPVVTATAVRADGRRGVMTVETGLDVADAKLAERAQGSVPRLRAAYNGVVQTTANGLRPGMPPDIEQLVRDLQAATDTVLGQGGARLLIGTVMII